MPNLTPRLELEQPVGGDTPSVIRLSDTNNTSTLDGAVIITEGVLTSRPSTGLFYGQTYYATDVGNGTWYFYNGTAWVVISFAPNVRSVSTNVTAAPGDYIIAGANVTVTLSSNASATSLPIRIVAASTVTGASPVVVSGSGIYGLGLTNATSFLLGAGEAAATLIAGGGGWTIVGGHQDTGFIALILAAKVNSFFPNTYVPGARMVGDRVYLQGLVIGSGSGGVAPGSPIATLPLSLMFPTATVGPWVGYDSAQGIVELSMSTAGILTSASAFDSTSKLSFENVSFSVT